MNIRHIAAALGPLVMGVSLAGAQSFEPPRTADGKPDLQGVWDFRTLTPLQRPENQADQAVLTAEEVAELDAQSAASEAAAFAPSEVRNEPLPVGGDVGAYNSYWVDQGASVVDDQRTSLIVDPPTGRLPELQPGIELAVLSLGEDLPGTRPVRVRAAGIAADSWHDRGLSERCLLGFNSGPPIVPAGYNQNIQIFQTPDHVAILHEMVHDARIVPLDRRMHLPENVRQWMGDSRGYWDGDTLVVETRSFTDKTASFNPSVVTAAGTGATLRLTERFRRVGDDTLLYEYTVDDASTFTQPFTAALPMKRGDAMFEYACHEGNYGLPNMLAGARVAEAAATSGQ
ncbi:MAG: hypothetical protein CL477_07570 [Acidobacteria bacterium]|jgi:hypothetical protein|nr:hypothetical protein [Acidobacteriota bacterium]|tara:strand:- start:1738 stop:2766 length:1029 start_codon:yes stop_codon:yes gene_type:complete